MDYKSLLFDVDENEMMAVSSPMQSQIQAQYIVAIEDLKTKVAEHFRLPRTLIEQNCRVVFTGIEIAERGRYFVRMHLEPIAGAFGVLSEAAAKAWTEISADVGGAEHRAPE